MASEFTVLLDKKDGFESNGFEIPVYSTELSLHKFLDKNCIAVY